MVDGQDRDRGNIYPGARFLFFGTKNLGSGKIRLHLDSVTHFIPGSVYRKRDFVIG